MTSAHDFIVQRIAALNGFSLAAVLAISNAVLSCHKIKNLRNQPINKKTLNELRFLAKDLSNDPKINCDIDLIFSIWEQELVQ